MIPVPTVKSGWKKSEGVFVRLCAGTGMILSDLPLKRYFSGFLICGKPAQRVSLSQEDEDR